MPILQPLARLSTLTLDAGRIVHGVGDGGEFAVIGGFGYQVDADVMPALVAGPFTPSPDPGELAGVQVDPVAGRPWQVPRRRISGN